MLRVVVGEAIDVGASMVKGVRPKPGSLDPTSPRPYLISKCTSAGLSPIVSKSFFNH